VDRCVSGVVEDHCLLLGLVGPAGLEGNLLGGEDLDQRDE